MRGREGVREEGWTRGREGGGGVQEKKLKKEKKRKEMKSMEYINIMC